MGRRWQSDDIVDDGASESLMEYDEYDDDPFLPPVIVERRRPAVMLTAAGIAKLSTEIDHLRTVELPGIRDRLEAAQDGGWDILENSDLAVARDEWRAAEARAATIEALLSNMIVIEEPDTYDTVIFGSRLTVEIGGEIEHYQIVGPTESDPKNGKISDQSPLGKMLFGHHPGDEVMVIAPAFSYVARLVCIDAMPQVVPQAAIRGQETATFDGSPDATEDIVTLEIQSQTGDDRS